MLYNEGAFVHGPLGPGEILADMNEGYPKGTRGIVVVDNPLFATLDLVARNNLVYNFNVGFGVISHCMGGSALLENNTIAGNVDVGLHRDAWVGLGPGDCVSPVSLQISNSIFYANGSPGNAYDHDILDNLSGLSAIQLDYSDIEETVYPGMGNISLPPLFVDAASGNYTLQTIADGYPEDSPCIDAGKPDPAYNDENGSLNDMGYTGGPGGFNTPGSGNHTIEIEELSIEFQDLSQAGRTSVEKIELVEPYNLPNITLDFIMALGGFDPFYFEVSTTAEFENIEVCIDLGFDLSPLAEFLKLYTLGENGDLIEIEGSYIIGTCICGVIDHLSPIIAAIPDTDEDGYYDHKDNCPSKFNPDQADLNGNGVGDACESTEWGQPPAWRCRARVVKG